MGRNPEWIRYATLEYIKAMAEYPALQQADLEHMERLRAVMEGVGAIRYDRDGSPTGYVDRMPEHMDRMEELADSLRGRMVAREEEYQRALALFNGDPRARMAWEKHGAHMTWGQISRVENWSVSACRRMAEAGLAFIYDRMPEEYRRVHVNAEDWKE